MGKEERQKILEKIKKLLSLSNSLNEHEAELAALRAREILARYNLSLSDTEINNDESLKSAIRLDIDFNEKWTAATTTLAWAVSNATDCKWFMRYNPKTYRGDKAAYNIAFIGVGADVQVASYLFTYLYRTMSKLSYKYLKQNKHLKDKRNARVSYMRGMATTLNERLKKEKQEVPTNSQALVVIKEKLVKDLFDSFHVRSSNKKTTLSDYDAYYTGKKDGNNIPINPAMGTHQSYSSVTQGNFALGGIRR